MRKQIDQWNINKVRIHPKLNLIRKEDLEIAIKPRLMHLLEYFLLHQNEVVVKEDILNYVWEGRIVTENLLTKSISELRKILAEHLPAELEIETIRNVGYRFNAPQPILSSQAASEKQLVKPNKARNWYLWLISSAALLLVVLLFTFSRQESSKDYRIEVERISSLKGQETSPVLSPDGAYIAYSWRKKITDPFHIYIRSLEEDNARKLTDHKGIEYNPTWSPDGRQLAYMLNDTTGGRWIMRQSVIGADELRLVSLGDLILGRGMIWTADGEGLVFSAKSSSNAPFQIMNFDFKTSEIEPLTEVREPSFGDIFPTLTNDPQQIAFVRTEQGKSMLSENASINPIIHLLDLKSGDIQVVSHLKGEIMDMVYHPYLDQYLCWISNEVADNSLIGVNALGEQNLLHSINNGMPGKGVAGPGNQFLFEFWHSNLNVHEYQIVDNQQSVRYKREYLNSTLWDWGLQFAAKTNDIAFISLRTGYQEIWVAERETPDNARQLTDIKSPLIKSISLSPDGKSLIWLSIEGEQSYLNYIKTNGEENNRITAPGTYGSPVWSNDGASIFYPSYEDGQWNIFRQNLETKAVEAMTEHGGHSLFVSPQFQEDLFYCKFNQDTIYKQLLPSGESAVLAYLPGLESGNWVVNENGIYYIAWEQGKSSLRLYDFEREEIRTLEVLEHLLPGIPCLSISPDGQRIYIAKSDAINADIISYQFE